jgi:hypothetical protein
MTTAVAQKPETAPLPETPPVDPLANVSPDTLARAIALVEEQQAAERAAAEARRRQAETGYPKELYNPVYPRERIRHETGKPNKEGRRPSQTFEFAGGRITVQNPEEERIVRAACRGRVYDADTDQLQVCKKCGVAFKSHAAMNVHRDLYHP